MSVRGRVCLNKARSDNKVVDVVVHAANTGTTIGDLKVHEAIFTPRGTPGVLDCPVSANLLGSLGQTRLFAALILTIVDQATGTSLSSLASILVSATRLLGGVSEFTSWSVSDESDRVVKSRRAVVCKSENSSIVVAENIISSCKSNRKWTHFELRDNPISCVGKSTVADSYRVRGGLTTLVLALSTVAFSVGVVGGELGTTSVHGHLPVIVGPATFAAVSVINTVHTLLLRELNWTFNRSC